MKTLWGQWKYSNALISAPDGQESLGSDRPLRLQEAATGTYCRECWMGPSVGPSVLLYILHNTTFFVRAENLLHR